MTCAKKELKVLPARVLLDCSLEKAATITMKDCSAGALGVFVDNVPCVLVRGDGRWSTTPLGSIPGNTIEYTRQELIDEIRNGSIMWFDPKPVAAVATSEEGITPAKDCGRVSAAGWQPDMSNADDSYDEGVDYDVDETQADEPSDDSISEIDDCHETSAEDKVFPVKDPYVRMKLIRLLSTWPAIYALGLARSNSLPIPGSGYIFNITEDPIAANGGGCRQPSAALFRAPPLFGIFDPFTQYPSEVPLYSELCCPHCGRKGNLTSKGFSNGAKRMFGLETVTSIVTRRLRCKYCPQAKDGKSERCCTLLHPGIIAQFGPALRAILPVPVGSALFEKSLVNLIVDMRTQGNSVATIESVLRGMYAGRHARQWNSYLLAMYSWRKSVAGNLGQVNTEDFGQFGSHGERSPSILMIRRCILNYILRLKRTMLQHISSLTGECLKADHTFWTSKAIAYGSTHQRPWSSLHAIMNEYGQIIDFTFCKTKSTHDLASNLQKLGERYQNVDGNAASSPKVMYVDNPNEVKALLKNGNEGGSFRGFGSSFHVLHDPFHLLLNIGDSLNKKHPLSPSFMGTFLCKICCMQLLV